MTLDQLTELAARVTDTSIPIYAFTLDELAALAEAIAAAEREACAAICDAEADEFGGMSDGFYAAKNCAEAIRARGGE